MTIQEIIKKISKRNYIYESNKISEWLSWYNGKVNTFHFYNKYNGVKNVRKERVSLGMAKKICEDWADLLLNEKTKIVLGSEKDQKIFDKYLAESNFWQRANTLVEMYMALGMGAIVETIKDIEVGENGVIVNNGKIELQFINATKIYPITIVNDKITECGFANQSKDKTLITIHLLNEKGNYDIHNLICDNKNGNIIFDEKNYYVYKTNSKTPKFQIFKPNIVNNLDINSNLGISVFANAIDILKNVDLSYDTLSSELSQGRKRTFISTKLLNYNAKNGDEYEVFDEEDLSVYILPESEMEKPYIQNDTQELRVNSITLALQKNLDCLSQKCGFGANHYKFENDNITTATQVISENSDLFRTIKKHEILIEQNLIDFSRALIELINTYTDDKIDINTSVQIQFDDSIIEDLEKMKQSDRLDVANGIMSKAEFRAKYYGEDIEQAQKKIDEITKQDFTKMASYILSIRDDISHKTALELYPFIDNAEEELKRIEEEEMFNIRLEKQKGSEEK